MKRNHTPDDVKELINKAGTILHKSPDECIRFAKEALLISENLKFDAGIGMALMNIGLGNFYQAKYWGAIEHYEKAIEIFRKIDFKPAISQLYNNFGAVYCELKDFAKGLNYFTRALEIDTELGYDKNIALELNNIGNVYLQTENQVKAIEHYEKSLEIARKNNYENSICNTLTNIGNIYKITGDLESAKNYLNESVELCTKTNNQKVLIRTYLFLSAIYISETNYKKAIQTLNRSIFLSLEVNSIGDRINSETKLATVYMHLKDYVKALNILSRLENEIRQDDLEHNHEQVFLQLSNLFKETNDFEKAYDYYKKFHEISIKIVQKKQSEKLADLKLKYEIDAKERELDFTKAQNILLQQEVETGIAKWKKQHQLLIQKSKLESLGKLAAGIAHEINQPLQAISLGLENVKNKAKNKNITDEYITRKIHNFSENIVRIKKIIEHIRIFSREQTSLEIDVFDVNTMIEKALNVLKIQFKKNNIELIVELSDNPLKTAGNKYRLEQVLINLLSNACDAVEFNSEKKEKDISIISRYYDDKIMLKISDNGVGISESNMDDIFNPFFTTKNPEQGTGLGLSIAYGIIKEMNGEITVESKIGEGTVFVVTLPRIKD